MNNLHRLPLLVIACAGVFGVPACQSSLAFAADTPRPQTPSIDIEIEDRSPSAGSTHTAKFNVALTNGMGDINTADGDTRYHLNAHTISASDPKLAVNVKRADSRPGAPPELEVSAAIPQQPSGRILVARIDRADGHVTTIVAQAR